MIEAAPRSSRWARCSGLSSCVGTDAGLIPDPERIIDGFHAEFESLQRAAR